MTDSLSGIKVLHVATLAEVLVHFKLPLLQKLAEAGARQSIYCSDEQYCRDRQDSYDEGGHLRMLLDLGYNVKVGSISRRLSLSKLHEILTLFRHIRSEGYDMVIAHQPVAALVAMPAATLAKTPFKIYFSGGLRVVTRADRIINKYGEHMMVWLSDATMLNNLEDFEYVRTLQGGTKKARFVSAMEGCGIDTDGISPEMRREGRVEARRRLSIDDETAVVCYAGRLVWEKGIRELIMAASSLQQESPERKIRYLMIGVGPDSGEMQEMIENAGLADKFIFIGYRFDMISYLIASDIFVLPSYREGLPTALLEAMTLGLPCIATDIRGSRELVKDKISGLIVRPRSPDGLACALTACLDDPAMAERLGKEARRTVEEKYSRKTLLPRTLSMLREIISDSNGKPSPVA